MEEKRLTERESLALITEMISRTKSRYIGDGNIMLMWGYLTVTVTTAVWVALALTRNPAWNWLWFLIGVVGGILTPLMSRKQQLKQGVKSYSDKVTSQIWTVVGISAMACTLCCVVFSFLGVVNCWLSMLVFALMIVPLGEIMQGIVVKERVLMFGGAVGLCAGIITLCCVAGGVALQASWFFPMFIVAFMCMMIIPGHVINRKAKH